MAIDTFLLVYVLAGLVAALAGAVVYLWLKVTRLLRGKDAATLEDTMRQLLAETDALHKSQKEVEQYLRQVERRLKKSVSGVATVRFNPFKGSGGNQSFATAFLSEEGNGVVLSTLYSRDRVSIFAKPVSRGSSQYELTDEEREAIAKSRPGR